MINTTKAGDSHVGIDLQDYEDAVEEYEDSSSNEYLLVSISHDDCDCSYNSNVMSVEGTASCNKSTDVALPVIIRKSIREILCTSLMLTGMLIVLNGSHLISSISIYASFAICSVLGVALGLLMVLCSLKPIQSQKNSA
ncbi:hypothetical protein [Candidatus Ichthyocystis hellenicum]|uniref:hypothetical protein n=1 Tax=Candidatus Ichthyocystis hellenicum TaxID=1561003 RepID=UPI001111A1EA|nr:hypothetical protein [Candidatus Ichthyocystis hellenicum]